MKSAAFGYSVKRNANQNEGRIGMDVSTEMSRSTDRTWRDAQPYEWRAVGLADDLDGEAECGDCGDCGSCGNCGCEGNLAPRFEAGAREEEGSAPQG